MIKTLLMLVPFLLGSRLCAETAFDFRRPLDNTSLGTIDGPTGDVSLKSGASLSLFGPSGRVTCSSSGTFSGLFAESLRLSHDGSPGSPSVAVNSTSGLYNDGGSIGISQGSVRSFRVTSGTGGCGSDSSTAYGCLRGGAGSISAPNIYLFGDTDTGLHLPGSDRLHLIAGGSTGLSVGPSQGVTAHSSMTVKATGNTQFSLETSSGIKVTTGRIEIGAGGYLVWPNGEISTAPVSAGGGGGGSGDMILNSTQTVTAAKVFTSSLTVGFVGFTLEVSTQHGRYVNGFTQVASTAPLVASTVTFTNLGTTGAKYELHYRLKKINTTGRIVIRFGNSAAQYIVGGVVFDNDLGQQNAPTGAQTEIRICNTNADMEINGTCAGVFHFVQSITTQWTFWGTGQSYGTTSNRIGVQIIGGRHNAAPESTMSVFATSGQFEGELRIIQREP